MNKKALILFGVGVLFLVLVVVLINFKKKDSGVGDNDIVKEISFSERPFVSLIPSQDGHWLTLKVEKIVIDKASSLDYELLYSLPDGRTQGVPGTVDLKGEKSFERKLLLGSESSGKFRYDEGVKEGSLTIRVRDQKGKLLAKFSTKWHLQSEEQELTSVDQKFVYKFDKKPKGIFFVTMETFGLPNGEALSTVEGGPYGIFASSDLPSGTAEGWQATSGNLFYK